MADIQIKTKVTIEMNELLNAVSQLAQTDFEYFFEQVLSLKNDRKIAKRKDKEALLIQQIRNGLTADERARLHELQDKQSLSEISELEHDELGQLVIKIEELHTARILAIGELAEIRNQPVDELSTELGFKPITYA